METEKKTYSVEELAFTLGISKSSCYALIKEGQFRTVRVGTRILIPKTCIEKWLNGEEEKVNG